MPDSPRPSTAPREGPSGRACGLAALLYLGVALVWMGDVWSRPTERTLMATGEPNAVALSHADQQMVVATITDNARRLLDGERALYDSGSCHPMPQSFTLGEHMWGNGLLAALPLAITGEPLLAYNAVLLLLVWLAGVAMFAASYEWTRSAPAALVAGLAFELFRPRLADPVHPYVNADLWTVAALFFLCRLFRRGDWGSALGLAVAGTLQLGESLYPVLSATVLLGAATLALAVRRRDVLLARLPKLLACGVVAGLAAWFVFGPYLDAAETWGILEGRVSPQLGLGVFAMGGRFFPGVVLLVLALVGLLDRARGPRNENTVDLRIALAVAGALLFWMSVESVPVPFTERKLWSPMPVLRAVVPGLSAVRAAFGVHAGAQLVLCVLAGYGILWITERRSEGVRVAVAAVAAVALVAESAHPVLARASFGATLPIRAAQFAFAPAERVVLRSLGDVTVIDYPPRPGNLIAHAHYLHAGVEHGGRTGACYNSFDSPVVNDVGKIARGLPGARAAAALAALGFDAVLVHLDTMPEPFEQRFRSQLDLGRWGASGLTEVARTEKHVVFRLESPSASIEDWSVLAPVESDAVGIRGPRATVPFRFGNPTSSAFRHPAPLAPTPLLVRWLTAGGVEAAVSRVRALLPVAVGPSSHLARTVELDVAVPPGEYRLDLSRAAEPERVLASAVVRVHGP